MDKKKVKELIEQILKYCDQCYNPNWQPKSFEEFVKLGNICREAIKELSKSDWISVEDRLPEYGEKVYVKSERSPHLIQTHREDFDENDGKFHPFRNNNKFILEKGIYGKITHWKPIEKLEE